MRTEAGALETAELMFGCFKRLHRLVDSELGSCGMSLSRTKLLSEIVQNGPQNQGALATTFGLAPRTVTELVDGLERDGLVERRTDPADRRARVVHVTPAGEHTRERAAAIRQVVFDQVFGGLDERQIAGLADALTTIRTRIDAIEADRGPTRSAPPPSGSAAGSPSRAT